jgi:hypothetical protein
MMLLNCDNYFLSLCYNNTILTNENKIMLNTVRRVQTLMFCLEQDIHLGIDIPAGWYQIRLENNQYCMYRFEDMLNVFQVLPTEQMPNLLRIVCRMLINSGYMEDYQDNTLRLVQDNQQNTLSKVA